MNKYQMNFNQQLNQWFVDINERVYALHCGESFQLCIGRRRIPCRLELANNWYVVMDDTSFDLKTSEQYTILF